MKRFIFGLLAFLCMGVSITFAEVPYKTITLYPGWNVVSTPAILSSIEFLDGESGISFSKMENGTRINVPANATNIKPLEGYLVNNSNNTNKLITLMYKTGATPAESMLQKTLNLGWNFLGITTINNPFSHISGANMSVDFTNNGTSNLRNKVNTNYIWNSTSSNINNPQLGEAYGIFVNQDSVIYGGINNGGVAIDNVDCEDTDVILACLEDLSNCPDACKADYQDNNVVIPAAPSSKNTVLLKAKNSQLATFTVKSANNNVGLTLENIKFTGDIAGASMLGDKIRVKVDGCEYDVESETTMIMEYITNVDLPTEGLVVEVILKNEVTGSVALTVTEINGSTGVTKRFSRFYADGLVYLTKQQNEGDFTKYTLGVDLFDYDYEVTNFALYTGDANPAGTACAGTMLNPSVIATVEDGDTFEIDNGSTSITIGCVQYTVNGTTYAFDRTTYPDYFKVDGSAWRVFSVN